MDSVFKNSPLNSIPPEGISTEWRSPSNIALVKYWGKFAGQIPANPSVSLTLTHSHTTTRLSILPASRGGMQLHFKYDGKEKPDFSQRIETTLNQWAGYFPFIMNSIISVDTHNSFPHSAGIASSASAMSALALCLMDIESQLGLELRKDDFLRKASFIARLGSGSAARSVFPYASIWGYSKDIPDSSDEFGIEVPKVHSDFKQYMDTILLVDPGEKTVSSSAGHALMPQHPFASERYKQAEMHSRQILNALESGDIDTFVAITETEALTLHALMMSSNPGYILLKGNTLEIIHRIRQFREQSGIKACFTLDAGPNVHLLYPWEVKDSVMEFINRELRGFCEGGRIMVDQVGSGPEKI